MLILLKFQCNFSAFPPITNIFWYITIITVVMLSALGCPDVEKPRYGWLMRERAGIAVLGCNESSRVWRLTCDDNHWTGPTVNCSPPGIPNQ